MSDDAEFYATASTAERSQRIEDELADEAGERWSQMQSDLDRGK